WIKDKKKAAVVRWLYDTADTTPIYASAQSADHTLEVAFDASPYFREADEAEIAALAQAGWTHGAAATAVARRCAPEDGTLTTLFTYLELYNHGRQKAAVVGLECTIESESAVAWLQAARPGVRERVQARLDRQAATPQGGIL